MAEITQRLGFEASGAINTCYALSQAIASVNRNLTQMRTLTQTFKGGALSQALKTTRTDAVAADIAISRLRNSMVQAGTQGARAGRDITLSWQTMLRVVQTQVLVRSLNVLISSFREGADAAEQFQLSVARMSNIAEGPGSSIDELSESVKRLAVELGAPVAEVADAAYEALQNDLGTTKDTMELLSGAASDLSVITGGSLTQSVNTLTSVLKSYNLEISESSSIVDTLFTAIDKGRITLSELESGLGRLLPLSAQLNISLEETFAAIASISQSGLDAAAAQTQFRNVLIQLIRPNTVLARALNELGTTSFQQLQDRLGGMQPALKAIADVLNNDQDSIARAFGTIRGQLGIFNLLANESKNYVNVLDAMAEKDGRSKTARAIVDETDARRSQKALAQLSNTMLEMGESSQRLRTLGYEALNAIASDSQQAWLALGTVSGAVVALTVNMTRLRAVAFASIPVGSLLGGVLAFAATAGALSFATDKIIDSVMSLDTALMATNKEWEKQNENVKEFESTATRSLEAIAKASSSAFRESIGNWGQDLDRSFQELSANAQRASLQVAASFRQVAGDFVLSREDALKRMQSLIDSIDQQVQNSTKQILGGMRALDDFKFSRSLNNLNEFQRVAALTRRATEAIGEARRAAATAGVDPERQRLAQELQQIAEKRAQEALGAADRVDNAAWVARAEKQVAEAIQLGITRETQYRQSLLQVSRTQATEEVRAGEERLKVQKDLLSQIQETQTVMSSPLRTQEQLAGDRERLASLRSQLQESLQLDSDAGIFSRLGERGIIEQTRRALESGLASADFDFSNVRSRLQDQLAASPFTIELAIARAAGADTGSARVNELLGQVEGGAPAARAISQWEKLNAAILGNADAANKAANAQRSMNSEEERFRSILEGASFAPPVQREVQSGAQFRGAARMLQEPDNLAPVREELNALAVAMDEVSDAASLGVFEEKLKAARTEFSEMVREGQALTVNQAKDLNVAVQVLERFRQEARTLYPEDAPSILESLLSEEDVRTIEARMRSIQENIRMTNPGQMQEEIRSQAVETQQSLQNSTTSAQGTETAVGEIVTTLGQIPSAISVAVSGMQNLEQSAIAAAQAINLANQASANNGGFSGQAIAMNPGSSSTTTSSTTSNTYMGGVNINVNGAQSPQATSREVAAQLNRESRRGASQIRRYS